MEQNNLHFQLQRIFGSKNIAIVDVRTQEEYLQISIPNAIHIPLAELPQRVNELQNFDEVHFFCRAGVRGQIAVEIAKNAGINALPILNSVFEISEAVTKLTQKL